MRLAVIPARGGSKRIPRKNVKLFCGQPIIAYSIQLAKACGCFDRIIVSTDDAEIAAIALDFGAEVPFMRPAELADDFTGTLPVVKHALEWFLSRKSDFKQVCCIYPTAPLLRADHLSAGLTALETSGCAYAFSVTSYPFPIQRAVRINAGGRVEMFLPEQFNTRSQDLEPAYHDAGQFYWGTAEAYLQQIPFFTPYSVPVILPEYRVQDIDTLDDWVRAELLFKLLQEYEID